MIPFGTKSILPASSLQIRRIDHLVVRLRIESGQSGRVLPESATICVGSAVDHLPGVLEGASVSIRLTPFAAFGPIEGNASRASFSREFTNYTPSRKQDRAHCYAGKRRVPDGTHHNGNKQYPVSAGNGMDFPPVLRKAHWRETGNSNRLPLLCCKALMGGNAQSRPCPLSFRCRPRMEKRRRLCRCLSPGETANRVDATVYRNAPHRLLR